VKAYGGSPPPFDQPGLVALLKSKTVIGDEGGEGGVVGGDGGVNMQMHFLLEEHEPELSPP
jgi:hypothetical protein